MTYLSFFVKQKFIIHMLLFMKQNCIVHPLLSIKQNQVYLLHPMKQNL